MMLSHAVRQALVEPGMAKISVRLATPATAGLQRRSADLFEGQHAEHFAKAFDLTIKQRQQRFRRLIAVGKTGAAGDQHHLHVIAGYPRRYLSADGVAILFDDRLLDDLVPRLLRRLAQPVTGSVVLFAATAGNGKNSNTGRDKLSASPLI